MISALERMKAGQVSKKGWWHGRGNVNTLKEVVRESLTNEIDKWDEWGPEGGEGAWYLKVLGCDWVVGAEATILLSLFCLRRGCFLLRVSHYWKLEQWRFTVLGLWASEEGSQFVRSSDGCDKSSDWRQISSELGLGGAVKPALVLWLWKKHRAATDILLLMVLFVCNMIFWECLVLAFIWHETGILSFIQWSLFAEKNCLQPPAPHICSINHYFCLPVNFIGVFVHQFLPVFIFLGFIFSFAGICSSDCLGRRVWMFNFSVAVSLKTAFLFHLPTWVYVWPSPDLGRQLHLTWHVPLCSRSYLFATTCVS